MFGQRAAQLFNSALETMMDCSEHEHESQQNIESTRENSILAPSVQAISPEPRLEIVVQPARYAVRFRYKSEKSFGGPLLGIDSSPGNNTFPTIKLEGCTQRARVVVSCITKDEPYKVHPHNLMGDDCRKGVCWLEVPPDSVWVHEFKNLGIQCVTKRDIKDVFAEREKIRVDPFHRYFYFILEGFRHREEIDLSIVRLCFQVLLENPEKPGDFNIPLQPVVSGPIYDKKTFPDLAIVKLSDCVSEADGGRKDIILLCEKVVKDDIEVWFYEKENDKIVWSAMATDIQIYKNHAIWFRTPKYRTNDVEDSVDVFIELRRPSGGSTSPPIPFKLIPSGKRKKPSKIDNPDQITKYLQELNRKTVEPKPWSFESTPQQQSRNNLAASSNFLQTQPSNSPALKTQSVGSDELVHSIDHTMNPLLLGVGFSQPDMDAFSTGISPESQPNLINILDLNTEALNSDELATLVQTNVNENNLPLPDLAICQQDLHISDGDVSKPYQKRHRLLHHADLQNEMRKSENLFFLNTAGNSGTPPQGFNRREAVGKPFDKHHSVINQLDKSISSNGLDIFKNNANPLLDHGESQQANCPQHNTAKDSRMRSIMDIDINKLNSLSKNTANPLLNIGTSQQNMDSCREGSSSFQKQHNIYKVLRTSSIIDMDIDKLNNNLNNSNMDHLLDTGMSQQYIDSSTRVSPLFQHGIYSVKAEFNNLSKDNADFLRHIGTCQQDLNISARVSNSQQWHNVKRTSYNSAYTDDNYYDDQELPLSDLSSLSLSDEIPCGT